ncbi:hypothetical protein BH11BAC7_BH11BAC7_19620 [soil metagenome]
MVATLVASYNRLWFDAEEDGIIIINLDNLTRLIYYENTLGVDSFQSIEEPDTTDSLAEPIVSTVEDHRYEKYIVSITMKKIIIKQECLSPDQNDEEQNSQNSDCDETIYTYRLTKIGLIRQK